MIESVVNLIKRSIAKHYVSLFLMPLVVFSAMTSAYSMVTMLGGVSPYVVTTFSQTEINDHHFANCKNDNNHASGYVVVHCHDLGCGAIYTLTSVYPLEYIMTVGFVPIVSKSVFYQSINLKKPDIPPIFLS